MKVQIVNLQDNTCTISMYILGFKVGISTSFYTSNSYEDI